jgi:flagellar biosynthesis/type III secretory pathway protein FliH
MARVIRAAGASAAVADERAAGGPGAAGATRPLAAEILRAAEEEAKRIRAAAEEEAGRLRAQAEAVRAAVEEEGRRRRQALEVDVAGLALAVAVKLLGRVAEEDEGLAREMARRALARLPAAGQVVIRVNPADAASVRSGLPSLSAGAPLAGRLVVREDPGVGRGGAVAESATASADARLEAQLDEVTRVLRGPG